MTPDPILPRGPRHVLLRYLSTALMTRILLCCGILIALMEILALLEQMTPILRRHLGIMGVLTYMALHLPAMLQTALPLSVLIGGLLTFTQMTVSSEIAILRAAGLSPYGFIKLLLPITLLTGGFGIVLEDQITPRTELALAAWWNRSDPQPEDGHAFWFRLPHEGAAACGGAAGVGAELVHVGYIAHAGREAYKIDLYDRNAQGHMIRALHAGRATYAAGKWSLSDIACVTVVPQELDITARTSTLPAAAWDNPFGPRDMLRLSLEAAPLSTGTILGALHGRVPTNFTPGYLKGALLERYLRPLALVVMLLLAMPVIYIPPRTGLRSWLPVWCLGTGLLFIVVQGMFRAMGNAGLLPAPVATIPGLIIFSLAAGTALVRNEEK